MRAQPQASHFIDGHYVEDDAGAVIECIYPATGEIVARLHEATAATVDRALAAASAAGAEWSSMTGSERGRILRRGVVGPGAKWIRPLSASCSRPVKP